MAGPFDFLPDYNPRLDEPRRDPNVMNNLAVFIEQRRRAKELAQIQREQIAQREGEARMVDARERDRYGQDAENARASARMKAEQYASDLNEKRLAAARAAAPGVRTALNDRDLEGARMLATGVLDISERPGLNEESRYTGDDGYERVIPEGIAPDPTRDTYRVMPVGSVPGMDPFEVDPESNRRNRMGRANRDTDTFANTVTPKTDIEKRAHEYAVQVGRTGQGKDAIPDVYEERRRELETQTGLDERSRRAAARAGNREEIATNRDERAGGTYAWTRAQQVLSNFGFKEVQVQNRKFGDMAARLSADPNAALDAVTAGEFVKMAQGGTGVISDADMEAFWNRIGGVTDRTAQWVSNVLSGKIAPDKRQAVLSAVSWLASRARENRSEITGALQTALENDPNVTPEMRNAVMKTYGGGSAPKAQGASPAPRQTDIDDSAARARGRLQKRGAK